MNNGDLISREALKKDMCKICNEDYSDEPCEPSDCVFLNSIKNAPAVDAVGVVHAKWVNTPLCGNDNCRCSNCGSWHNIHANMRGEINYKYCPDCGSRMDGE